jgi:hypothetical protein
MYFVTNINQNQKSQINKYNVERIKVTNKLHQHQELSNKEKQ